MKKEIGKWVVGLNGKRGGRTVQRNRVRNGLKTPSVFENS